MNFIHLKVMMGILTKNGGQLTDVLFLLIRINREKE